MTKSPLENFIDSNKEKCILLQWVGGKLRRFLITENCYQWLLFPVHLEPGYHQLALWLIPPSWMKRSSSAYAVLFAPGTKIYTKALRKPAGFGFHMTPAIASKNNFSHFDNVTRFSTNFSGEHQIGVTSSNWDPTIESVQFEVALLREMRAFEAGLLHRP